MSSGYQGFSYGPPRQAPSYAQSSSPIHSRQDTSVRYGTLAYSGSNYRASAEAVDVEALDSGHQAFSYPPLRQALSYESSSPICSGQYASGNYGTYAYDTLDSTYCASAEAVDAEAPESDSEIEELRRRMNQL